jgi:hypothetical protein
VAAGWVLAALVLLASWRSAIPNRYDEAYLEALSLPSLLHGLAAGHALPALPVAAARMLSPGTWGLFWWLAPIVLLAGAPALRRPPAVLLAVCAATPLLLAWCAYSRVEAVAYYAGVTWNRMLLQASVPLFGLLALATRRLLSLASSSFRKGGSARACA